MPTGGSRMADRVAREHAEHLELREPLERDPPNLGTLIAHDASPPRDRRSARRGRRPEERARARAAGRRRAQAGTAAASTSFTRFGSIRIPGVIVAEMAALLMYRPLAAAGFARRSSSTTAR